MKIITPIAIATTMVGVTAPLVSACNKEGRIFVKTVEITNNPTKLQYIEGQDLDLIGILVKVTYSDNTTKELDVNDWSGVPQEGRFTTSPTKGELLKTSDTSFTVTCEGVTSEPVAITVDAKIATSIEVGGSFKTSYLEGDTLDLTGINVTVKFNDGNKLELDERDWSSTPSEGKFTTSPAMGETLETSDSSFTVYYDNLISGVIGITVGAITKVENWTQYTESTYLDLSASLTCVNKTDTYEFIINASKFEWTAKYNTPDFGVKPESADYLQFDVLSITTKTGELVESPAETTDDNTYYIERDSYLCIVHMNHVILDNDSIIITIKFNEEYTYNDAFAYFRDWERTVS